MTAAEQLPRLYTADNITNIIISSNSSSHNAAYVVTINIKPICNTIQYDTI